MSSQERIKGREGRGEVRGEVRGEGGRGRLRPSESVASSMASGLHRPAPAPAGAADLGRVLLTDDYFSDVNPRSMRRLMNVLYVTGRLLKAFQIEFNWYQLASWVNLTEQWPFRTSWIIYHHETYEEHIDDSTSLKHIYDKVKPLMGSLREASTLIELDRDERKLEVFLSFHRSTLTAADLKIFLPFTINLDPYIKKVIKEEHAQTAGEEDVAAGGAAAIYMNAKPHSKPFTHKKPQKIVTQQVLTGSQPSWAGWNNSSSPPQQQTYIQDPTQSHPMAVNPIVMLKSAFPGLGDVSTLRLSVMSTERVCALCRVALGGGVGGNVGVGGGGPGAGAAAALMKHRVCGLVLTVCRLDDLKPILELPFGDWELFKMLILNLREVEANLPSHTPAVTAIPEKPIDLEIDGIKPRPSLEHQRSRPTNVEKQVTLEEQMICGALQTLNEEAMEDLLQSEPADRAATDRAPAVSFRVENEADDGRVAFTARPRTRRGPRARPSSLRLADEPAPRLVARSLSVEDSARASSPGLDLRPRAPRRPTHAGSAERLARLKDKIATRERSPPSADAPASDDESAPLVSSPPSPPAPPSECAAASDSTASPPAASPSPSRSVPGGARPLDVDCVDRSSQEMTASTDFSPRSDFTEAESPRGSAGDLELLPTGKCGGREAARCRLARSGSDASLSRGAEPYTARLLSRGATDGSRGLWRQDALDAAEGAPPWPHEPDSAV